MLYIFKIKKVLFNRALTSERQTAGDERKRANYSLLSELKLNRLNIT